MQMTSLQYYSLEGFSYIGITSKSNQGSFSEIFFSEKGCHSVRRQKKKCGSNVENKKYFCKFSTQNTSFWHIFDTKFKISKVVKRGHSVKKLSKISCESLIKGGHQMRASQKRGLMSGSKFWKGDQSVLPCPSPIFKNFTRPG